MSKHRDLSQHWLQCAAALWPFLQIVCLDGPCLQHLSEASIVVQSECKALQACVSVNRTWEPH